MTNTIIWDLYRDGPLNGFIETRLPDRMILSFNPLQTQDEEINNGQYRTVVSSLIIFDIPDIICIDEKNPLRMSLDEWNIHRDAFI